MSKRSGRILRTGLVTGTIAFFGGLIVVAFFPKASKPLAMPAKPQETAPLSVFCAPSHVPAGENWVLVGSFVDLPSDLVVLPTSEAVSVLEVQRVSPKAIGARINATAGASGNLLLARSIATTFEAPLVVSLGQTPVPEAADANFTSEDLVEGALVVPGKVFLYGYLTTGESPISALRIHNRATGKWHCHEHAVEAARAAAEPVVALDTHFKEVDVLETLPDTDGNGVPDFAEEPETKIPVPGQLGVELLPGSNALDLVTVDGNGKSSWRTIQVYSQASTVDE